MAHYLLASHGVKKSIIISALFFSLISFKATADIASDAAELHKLVGTIANYVYNKDDELKADERYCEFEITNKYGSDVIGIMNNCWHHDSADPRCLRGDLWKDSAIGKSKYNEKCNLDTLLNFGGEMSKYGDYGWVWDLDDGRSVHMLVFAPSTEVLHDYSRNSVAYELVHWKDREFYIKKDALIDTDNKVIHLMGNPFFASRNCIEDDGGDCKRHDVTEDTSFPADWTDILFRLSKGEELWLGGGNKSNQCLISDWCDDDYKGGQYDFFRPEYAVGHYPFLAIGRGYTDSTLGDYIPIENPEYWCGDGGPASGQSYCTPTKSNASYGPEYYYNGLGVFIEEADYTPYKKVMNLGYCDNEEEMTGCHGATLKFSGDGTFIFTNVILKVYRDSKIIIDGNTKVIFNNSDIILMEDFEGPLFIYKANSLAKGLAELCVNLPEEGSLLGDNAGCSSVVASVLAGDTYCNPTYNDYKCIWIDYYPIDAAPVSLRFTEILHLKRVVDREDDSQDVDVVNEYIKTGLWSDEYLADSGVTLVRLEGPYIESFPLIMNERSGQPNPWELGSASNWAKFKLGTEITETIRECSSGELIPFSDNDNEDVAMGDYDDIITVQKKFVTTDKKFNCETLDFKTCDIKTDKDIYFLCYTEAFDKSEIFYPLKCEYIGYNADGVDGIVRLDKIKGKKNIYLVDKDRNWYEVDVNPAKLADNEYEETCVGQGGYNEYFLTTRCLDLFMVKTTTGNGTAATTGCMCNVGYVKSDTKGSFDIFGEFSDWCMPTDAVIEEKINSESFQNDPKKSDKAVLGDGNGTHTRVWVEGCSQGLIAAPDYKSCWPCSSGTFEDETILKGFCFPMDTNPDCGPDDKFDGDNCKPCGDENDFYVPEDDRLLGCKMCEWDEKVELIQKEGAYTDVNGVEQKYSFEVYTCVKVTCNKNQVIVEHMCDTCAYPMVPQDNECVPCPDGFEPDLNTYKCIESEEAPGEEEMAPKSAEFSGKETQFEKTDPDGMEADGAASQKDDEPADSDGDGTDGDSDGSGDDSDRTGFGANSAGCSMTPGSRSFSMALMFLMLILCVKFARFVIATPLSLRGGRRPTWQSSTITCCHSGESRNPVPISEGDK